jgi:hypothetical protein
MADLTESGQVREGVLKALKTLEKRDSLLLTLDANERSITHKLAEYLQQEFPNMNVDCEYNRDHDHVKRLYGLGSCTTRMDDTNARTVFPDIIIHKRNSSENLLVLEIKKQNNPEGPENDFEKLKAYMVELGYRYAAFVMLRTGLSPGIAEPQWVQPVGQARRSPR